MAISCGARSRTQPPNRQACRHSADETRDTPMIWSSTWRHDAICRPGWTAPRRGMGSGGRRETRRGPR